MSSRFKNTTIPIALITSCSAVLMSCATTTAPVTPIPPSVLSTKHFSTFVLSVQNITVMEHVSSTFVNPPQDTVMPALLKLPIYADTLTSALPIAFCDTLRYCDTAKSGINGKSIATFTCVIDTVALRVMSIRFTESENCDACQNPNSLEHMQNEFEVTSMPLTVQPDSSIIAELRGNDVAAALTEISYARSLYGGQSGTRSTTVISHGPLVDSSMIQIVWR